MSAPIRYQLTKRAARDLRRIDPDSTRRILDALNRFIEDPRHGDVKKLQGELEEYRLRVGDWRVRFYPEEDGRILVVTRILPRSIAYRD